jgi:site-specific DNA recombinase
LIDIDVAERVLAKLKQNSPKNTPPRVVNGPSLLTGIAVCASCGSGMTRTGTNRRGKSYSYLAALAAIRKARASAKGGIFQPLFSTISS